MEKVMQPKVPLATAIVAGITTFFTMSYILMVEPGMLSDLGEAYGVTFGAIFIATALGSAIGSFLIGWLADLPLAQAPGMGLNAFFVYTVCFGLGFTYANALVFVLVDGIIFIVLTATGLRRLIFDAIPREVKVAIPIGIGLFIAFLGFQDAGIVIPSSSTGVDLSSYNLLGGNVTLADIAPKIITMIVVIVMVVLGARKKPFPGAVLVSILGGTVVYYLLIALLGGGVSLNMISLGDAFSDFAKVSWLAVLKSGFDFSGYLATHSTADLVITFITTSLAFCMVDMFDTLGTLYGACKSGDLLVKNPDGTEEVPNMDRAMLADALATFIGSLLGISTVTTYVESSSGVGAGGKNRYTAYTTSVCFLVAMFFAPLASLVPACAYAAALIYVGLLMFKGIKDWDWDDILSVAAGFITAIVMPFTYNISYGICFGLVAYVMIKLFRHQAKEINAATWVITALFAVMLFTAR